MAKHDYARLDGLEATKKKQRDIVANISPRSGCDFSSLCNFGEDMPAAPRLLRLNF
jgi:hypothetical protein